MTVRSRTSFFLGRSWALPLVWTLFMPLGGSAQGAGTSYQLQSQYDEISSRGAAARAEWSALAVVLSTGDTLFAENPDQLLIPASNTKVLTTAAAFHLLGPEFRYTTSVLSRSEINAGVLDGDLILFGTGDPATARRFTRRGDPDALESLADQLVQQGLRVVNGDVIADASFLGQPGRFEEWSEDDLDDWFTAPIGGLSYNENLVTLRTSPGPIGDPPAVEVMPDIGREPVSNRAQTVAGSGRPDLIATRLTREGPITVIGSLFPGNRPIWKRMTVMDPTSFTGEALLSLLTERGVRVTGTVRAVNAPEDSPVHQTDTWAPGLDAGTTMRTLATHESPPLLDLMEVVNRESNNFYAETIFRTLGRTVVGDGSYEGGQQAMREFLAQVIGIPAQEVDQRDGSGLSPENRISASALVEVLRWVRSSPHADQFVSTLPEAGVRRGLGRMGRTAASRNLRAKTGTLASVSSLSGFVQSRDGELIAFSLISNGIRSRSFAKRLEDAIGVELASASVRSGTPSSQR